MHKNDGLIVRHTYLPQIRFSDITPFFYLNPYSNAKQHGYSQITGKGVRLTSQY